MPEAGLLGGDGSFSGGDPFGDIVLSDDGKGSGTANGDGGMNNNKNNGSNNAPSRKSRGNSALSEDYYKSLLARVDEAIVDTQTEHTNEALNASLMSGASDHRGDESCGEKAKQSALLAAEALGDILSAAWAGLSRCASRMCGAEPHHREGSARIGGNALGGVDPSSSRVSVEGHVPMLDV